MKTLPQLSVLIWVALFLLSSPFSSCNKQEDLYSFKGRVINANQEPVHNATIEIFATADDWLTGLNAVTRIKSDYDGYFESSESYTSGSYYIFIDKYDTSNWDIRSVENGQYPKVTIPSEPKDYLIEYNNISLLANTVWLLTNRHQEFTQPGQNATEWRSKWTSVNNCIKDNKIFFYKDLTMRISEGTTVCNNAEENIEGTFVPPIIFSATSCENLHNTSVRVKEFLYYGWPEMENKSGHMYLACDQNTGQLFIYYTGENGKKYLDVYSRQ